MSLYMHTHHIHIRKLVYICIHTNVTSNRSENELQSSRPGTINYLLHGFRVGGSKKKERVGDWERMDGPPSTHALSPQCYREDMIIHQGTTCICTYYILHIHACTNNNKYITFLQRANHNQLQGIICFISDL